MMRLTKYAQAAALLSRGSTLTSHAFTAPSALPPIQRNLSLKSTTDEESIAAKRSQWSRPDLAGQSLVDETLTQMENDVDFQEMAKQLQEFGKEGVARAERVKRREERAKRRRALDELGVPNFMKFVSDNNNDAVETAAVRDGQLYRTEPTILQLNIGLYCNQACSHCHVESSPLRKSETMSAEVAARCLTLLQSTPTVDTLDLTGGAPELNEQFRFLVKMAREWARENGRELTIIDRCNLTVLLEPDQEDLVDFFKENQVKVVASLPCYGESNVDAQRGMFGRFSECVLDFEPSHDTVPSES
jgi:sulfatase maturation enzyme AslB (radical SAM superfamily)